ncbi:MAG: hypothetical protein H8E71_00325 [Candidatus Marinimicrobia bacterium]|nr:hypothetical protein [Candidatus Neomarinimicrobiota bacterium]
MKMTKEIKTFCMKWLYDNIENELYKYQENIGNGKGDINFRLEEELGVNSEEMNIYGFMRHPFIDELSILVEKYREELDY